MTSFTHSHIPSEYKRLLINSVWEESWNEVVVTSFLGLPPLREGAEEKARAVKNTEAFLHSVCIHNNIQEHKFFAGFPLLCMIVNANRR